MFTTMRFEKRYGYYIYAWVDDLQAIRKDDSYVLWDRRNTLAKNFYNGERIKEIEVFCEILH